MTVDKSADLYDQAVSMANPEDYRSAALLVELAQVNPQEARKRILPVIVAARIWAEENFDGGSGNAKSEVPEGS